MSFSDEELQERIEKGIADESLDAKAYGRVFSVLKKEPYQLSVGFSDKVMSQIATPVSNLSKDYFWIGIGSLSFVIAAVLSFIFSDITINVSDFKLVGYSGLFIFGLAFIAVIQYLDKQFVRTKLS